MKKLIFLVVVLFCIGCEKENPFDPGDYPDLYDSYSVTITTNIGLVNYTGRYFNIYNTNINQQCNISVLSSTNPLVWVMNERTYWTGHLRVVDVASNYLNQTLWITVQWVVWK